MKKIPVFLLVFLFVLSSFPICALCEEETVVINGVTFSKDETKLIKYGAVGRKEHYDIPDTVTEIAEFAFEKAEFLKTITIPESVTKIGKGAFSFCSSLTEVTLPKGVTKIEDYSFDRCSALAKVVITGNVTSIGVRAFNECIALKSITIPSSLKNVGNGAFDVCSVLSEVYFLGTTDQWERISFDANNHFITTVSISKPRNIAPVIVLDGKEIPSENVDQPPIIEKGRTLVPLRAIFEALGATVEWDGETRTVTAVKGKTTISLTIDSTEMKINETVKTLDVAAKIVNSRTLVPVRAVAEAFGCEVMWDAETNTVIIDQK